MKNFFSKIFFPCLTQLVGLFFLFFCVFIPLAKSQSIIDELKAVSAGDLPLRNQLFSETITTVSSNRRIFIVTNSNNKLLMGDFISFIKDNQLVIRALVVKTRDDRSGLKLVKIYNQALLSGLQTGLNVEILRGDDSYFLSQLQREQETLIDTPLTVSERVNQQSEIKKEPSALTADEQMILGKDFSFEKDSLENRKINANHLLYFTAGNYKSLSTTGEDDSYMHYRIGWGYQFFNNWWTDFSYGHTVLKKYPEVDIDTALNTVTAKFGYIFQLPVHSFLYAYGGIYNSIASAPGAGEGVSDEQAQLEIQRIRDIEGLGFIGGVSFYKRLVPGWTFKLDFDLKNIGAGIMVEI